MPAAEDAGRRLIAECHQLEKRIKAEFEAGAKPSDPAVVQARATLRETFRELVLEHYELAQRKGVERSLWLLVFHRRIEEPVSYTHLTLPTIPLV